MIAVKVLDCCVCASRTKGRQWWNRDNGFGLCKKCADRISQKEDTETMKSWYGEKGYHYDIENKGDEK